jgi:hypothetical protein
MPADQQTSTPGPQASSLATRSTIEKKHSTLAQHAWDTSEAIKRTQSWVSNSHCTDELEKKGKISEEEWQANLDREEEVKDKESVERMEKRREEVRRRGW